MKLLYILTLTILFVVSIPLIGIIFFVLLIITGMPVFFSQKRIGKNGKVFTIYKFRTMVPDAERQKKNLMKLNEVELPVFKIHNDPRFTSFGKILSRTGFDELPQILNIIRREMNLIGPRPLPLDEADRIPRVYKDREKVLPGIISPWVVEGMHNLTFKRWMELDLEYVKVKSVKNDLQIIFKTAKLILRNIYLVLIGK